MIRESTLSWHLEMPAKYSYMKLALRLLCPFLALLLSATWIHAALEPAGPPIIASGGGVGQPNTISQRFLFTYVNASPHAVTIRFSGAIRIWGTNKTIEARSNLDSVTVNPNSTVTEIPFEISGTYRPEKNDSSTGQPEPVKVETHGSADSAEDSADDDSMQQGYLSFPLWAPHEAIIIQDRSSAR